MADAVGRKPLLSNDYHRVLTGNKPNTSVDSDLGDSIVGMTCILRMAHQNGIELVLRPHKFLRTQKKSRKEGHRNTL